MHLSAVAYTLVYRTKNFLMRCRDTRMAKIRDAYVHILFLQQAHA